MSQSDRIQDQSVTGAKPLLHSVHISSTARTYTMLAALVAVWVLFALATDGVFLEARNFSNLMRQATITATLAVGMLMVIVASHIDLSVGSIVGLAGCVAVMTQSSLGWGLTASILAALATGLAIGALQGFLVAYRKIPAFIVTLGGLLAWRGAVKGLSQGNTIPVQIPAFKSIGQDYLAPVAGIAIALIAVLATIAYNVQRERSRRRHKIDSQSHLQLGARIAFSVVLIVGLVWAFNRYAGIPVPVLLVLIVSLAGAVVMRNTVFGRHLYAIGGNSEAARLSGINIRFHVLAVFCVMGVLAGLAGIIYTARVGSAAADAGRLLELDAIAACVIGGTSLMGGKGSVQGALLGALFMASLDNGMSLQNFQDFTQDIVKGIVLVAAVGLDVASRRRG